METIARIRQALNGSGYEGDEIYLEETAGGRVVGHIISRSFQGMGHMDRQDLLWKQLSASLSPEILAKVLSILTLTPEEDTDEDEPRAIA